MPLPDDGHRYEAHPPREEYELTDKGRALLPIILSLAAWGNRWLMRDQVAIECVDAKTKRVVDPVLVDRSTRRELLAGEVALRDLGFNVENVLAQARKLL